MKWRSAPSNTLEGGVDNCGSGNMSATPADMRPPRPRFHRFRFPTTLTQPQVVGVNVVGKMAGGRAGARDRKRAEKESGNNGRNNETTTAKRQEAATNLSGKEAHGRDKT